jgi:hypothetical protein
MAQQPSDTTSIVWKEGYLDIHHILTGSGNSAFLVLPEGTTMLIDAGDIGNRKEKNGSESSFSYTPPYPDDSKSAAQWIVDYMQQVLPNKKLVLDYAILTHYHDDHMGGITKSTPKATSSDYYLTGITEIGEWIPIKKLIDRSSPSNDFPVDLNQYYHTEPNLFGNYQRFIAYKQKREQLIVEPLKVGSTAQLVLTHEKKRSLPNLSIRGIKSNGTIWSGIGDSTYIYFTARQVMDEKGKFNENPLSLAIKVSYGAFDYFTGGDNTGLQGFGMPSWFDVETPMAKAVGRVEVTTLNHHGCRDAVNDSFLKLMQPKVIVQQSWSTNHPGEEVLHRMIYAGIQHIFATNIQEATKKTLGFWLRDHYKSTFGHIIIRVLPDGQHFYVLIAETLMGKVSITKVFGPYTAE